MDLEHVHTEQSDLCLQCILKTMREMMQDRGYVSELRPPLPLPDAVDDGFLFRSDGQRETTDMQTDVYGLNYQQRAVVLIIRKTVSITVAREILQYRADHNIDRLIVVIASLLVKATPQVNSEFAANDIELFERNELVINRHRNSLVPRMRVLSPAEAALVPARNRGRITTYDKQYRYLRPPLGAVIEIVCNNGQLQPSVKYREVCA